MNKIIIASFLAFTVCCGGTNDFSVANQSDSGVSDSQITNDSQVVDSQTTDSQTSDSPVTDSIQDSSETEAGVDKCNYIQETSCILQLVMNTPNGPRPGGFITIFPTNETIKEYAKLNNSNVDNNLTKTWCDFILKTHPDYFPPFNQAISHVIGWDYGSTIAYSWAVTNNQKNPYSAEYNSNDIDVGLPNGHSALTCQYSMQYFYW